MSIAELVQSDKQAARDAIRDILRARASGKTPDKKQITSVWELMRQASMPASELETPLKLFDKRDQIREAKAEEQNARKAFQASMDALTGFDKEKLQPMLIELARLRNAVSEASNHLQIKSGSASNLEAIEAECRKLVGEN